MNNLFDSKLDLKALNLSKKINNLSLELIDVLLEIDKRKSFADLGFKSLFYYINKYLGFSESHSALYNNIIKSRLAENKKVLKMVETKEISLSSLGSLGSFIKNNPSQTNTAKKQEKIINLIKKKTHNETKEILKGLNGENTKVSPKKHKLTVKDTIFKKLQKIKKSQGEMTDEEALLFLINHYEVHKSSPKDSAQNLESKKIKTNKTITPKTRELLLEKSGHRCEFTSMGAKRCDAREFLEIDHIKPRAKGGTNHPDNLQVLCRTHNQRAGVLEFGVQKMNEFRGATFVAKERLSF